MRGCQCLDKQEQLSSQIAKEILQRHSKEITLLHFQPDQTIFYKGHKPCGIFVLLEGTVSFSFRVRREKVSKYLDVPTIIGWDHLCDQTPYCTTCQAKSHTKVAFIPKNIALHYHSNVQAILQNLN